MLPLSEIKTAIKDEEVGSCRAQNYKEFYEKTAQRLGRSSTLVGMVAVTEAYRRQYEGDTLVMAGIAGFMGALAVLSEWRASRFKDDNQPLRFDASPTESPAAAPSL